MIERREDYARSSAKRGYGLKNKRGVGGGVGPEWRSPAAYLELRREKQLIASEGAVDTQTDLSESKDFQRMTCLHGAARNDWKQRRTHVRPVRHRESTPWR